MMLCHLLTCWALWPFWHLPAHLPGCQAVHAACPRVGG